MYKCHDIVRFLNNTRTMTIAFYKDLTNHGTLADEDPTQLSINIIFINIESII